MDDILDLPDRCTHDAEYLQLQSISYGGYVCTDNLHIHAALKCGRCGKTIGKHADISPTGRVVENSDDP